MYTQVSIPQRSDLNIIVYLSPCIVNTVSIPQRSDLNRDAHAHNWVRVRMFQSRNGLIWTFMLFDSVPRDIYVSIPQRSDLNDLPAGVSDRIYSFNPATVWFEHECVATVDEAEEMFQSRNGLIWTNIAIVKAEIAEAFQSRNGLIWTRCLHAWHNLSCEVSIPQRSDLNWIRYVPHRNLYMFQSRNGLIWTYMEMM